MSSERRPSGSARQALPTGTLTFLFTDIEGSTRLAISLGNKFPSLLARHHMILRDAIAENGGMVISTEGDAFFAVFKDAAGGIAAARRAQDELAAPASR